MLKFKEFINESIDLILESDVTFSEQFTNILSKINNRLAKEILSLHKKDLPVTNNFFDLVKGDNSKVSFIQDRKAQQILSGDKKYVTFIGGNSGWLKHSSTNQNIFNILGYKAEGSAFRPNSVQVGEVVAEYKSPSSGKTYQYVKFEDGEGVYNVEKLRVVDSSQIPMSVKGRQDINVGRAMRALLTTANIQFTTKELEEFVNEFKSKVDLFGGKFANFDLVKGEDIRYWYNEENYLKLSGTLGSSCMRYESCQDYLDIYVMNPTVCNLLILKEGDKLIGRALVWTLINGKKFMDRIYYINDSDINLFREYAKMNQIYAKYYNGSSADNYVYDFDGNETKLDIKVQVGHKSYDYYPYMDTLKYFNTYNGILSTIDDGSDIYTLEDTEGGYSHCDRCNGTGRIECSDCDGNGETECSDCDGSGKEECYECDGDGEVNCSTCDGDGEVECSICDGEGEIDGEECNHCTIRKGKEACPDCSGSGKEECYKCDGDGEVNCSTCDGNGEYDCLECGGSGEYDCPECC
jgi:hypothetical protein